MRSLSIDIETYAETDLRKTGVYKYAEDECFEIMLLSYAADGGEVRQVDIASGEEIPDEVKLAILSDSCIKWAYNANFERVCLSRYLGEWLAPESWRCSMIWASYLGLPRSLEEVGAVLGLERQKLEGGKDLVRYFSKPCKPTKANGGRTRNLPKDAPDKWKQYKAYNLRDVEAETEVQQKLAKFPVPDAVWDEWHLDQRINDRGVRVDKELVWQALEADAMSRRQLEAAIRSRTGVDNPNSVSQLIRWLASRGVDTDTLDKKRAAELMQDAPEEVKEVLRMRLMLARSSVKKYQAMEQSTCKDGRARGMFQFYGANRTGRWAGRIIQLQNLPQNHLPDLAEARALVRSGDLQALAMLYDDIPDTLAQLIRTAFIPEEGKRFIVCDFSAIEARVIAWLAGEKWRRQVFAEGGDIYCASASQMFKVPVVKHGVNGHLRQKGKVAELACIAEGSLVLTDRGLLPIELVTVNHRLWDGESWVRHDGVIFKGEREVITYEGLTATEDHLVWIEGEPEPVRFGYAAASGAHLAQTGDGWKALRLGEDHQFREKMERETESLLCFDGMPGLRERPMAEPEQPDLREVEGLSKMFAPETVSSVAVQETDGGKAEVREPEGQRIPELRSPWDPVRLPQCEGCVYLPGGDLWYTGQEHGAGQDRSERELRSGESALCIPSGELYESAEKRAEHIPGGALAVCEVGSDQEAVSRDDEGRDNQGSGRGRQNEAEELAGHRRTARVYDIRSAGRNNRFTVSGKLVHNCGYGGSIGALKAMGALDMGLTEEELPGLISDWREANPNIVNYWWTIGDAAMEAVVSHTYSRLAHGITVRCQSGMLMIGLPSGRTLAYVKPKIGYNKFGGPCITYEGIGEAKKWTRLDTYGPKLVENIVQAISRDILCYAMKSLRERDIVMHIHDELVIEADERETLETISEIMGRTPPWAEGLQLRADGYETKFYRKD